jgi:hydrogenase nickel incorporation protein HypA/HybF
MHELGIAENILQIVRQSVPKESAADIRAVRLRVGQLSGVVPDSLSFCFDVLVNDTEMKQATLAIEQVPLISECRDCKNRFQMDDLAFSCPACQSTRLDLISGRELEVVEIELAEEGDKTL